MWRYYLNRRTVVAVLFKEKDRCGGITQREGPLWRYYLKKRTVVAVLFKEKDRCDGII